jgi:hypothetical protein
MWGLFKRDQLMLIAEKLYEKSSDMHTQLNLYCAYYTKVNRMAREALFEVQNILNNMISQLIKRNNFILNFFL